MKLDPRITKELDAINEKLDAIAETMSWTIRANARFRVGQRVEWSRHGRSQGFPSRKAAQQGTVKAVSDSFTVTVQLDGLKHPNKFHHAFFNPVSGSKLF